MTETAAQFETVEQAVREGASTPQSGKVKMWLAAIDAADKEERDWRIEGDEIISIYRSSHAQVKQQAFNILYSNTETILPAIYNSTPQPDIRRRYNDPGVDAKAVADILERAISYSLDQYDFDAVMRAVGFDAVGPGRGIARVRYVPKVMGNDPSTGEEGEQPEGSAYENTEHNELEEPEAGEQIVSQTVTCEYVPWKNFRRGPGLIWDDVPWIAFQHYLTRDQLQDLSPDGKDIGLDFDTRGEETEKAKAEGSKDPSEVFLRAQVWEIWDKMTGKVLFVSPAWPKRPLREEDDPLKLTGFFPIPRPIQPVDTPTDLVPVPMYRSYKQLAEELNEVTIRIRRLVRQMRVRGIYAASAASIEQIIKADDGELVPAEGLEMLLDGGLEKAIAWWPIDKIPPALAMLIEQRDAIKQTIYEVSGLADIMRGSTKSDETLGAQQIKAQWGSLRIQRLQAEVQRFCRDLFRMKAEIIAENFDLGMLQEMTGVKLATQVDKQMAQLQIQQMQQQAMMQAQQSGQEAPPPPVPDELQKVMEAPSAEAVEQMMRSDILRSYRIDVETDSTIRADLTRNMETMTQFVQGSAQYAQAIGPLVQEGVLPGDVAITIYQAFSRNFRLGRQVDTVLEQTADKAREAAKQPKQQQPDPAMEKVKADVQAKQAELQMKGQEMAMQQQQNEAELQMRQQELQLKAQELALKEQEMQQKAQIEAEKASVEINVKAREADTKEQIARQQAEQDMGHKSERHQFDMSQAAQEAEFNRNLAMQKAQADVAIKQQSEGERLKADNARADTQAKEGAKPRKRAVKIMRGADGRIAGAEIHD